MANRATLAREDALKLRNAWLSPAEIAAITASTEDAVRAAIASAGLPVEHGRVHFYAYLAATTRPTQSPEPEPCEPLEKGGKLSTLSADLLSERGVPSEYLAERKRRAQHIAECRAKGTGYSLDGKCHIDGNPCAKAHACEWRCAEVCSRFKPGRFECAHRSYCHRNHKYAFKCLFRDFQQQGEEK